uniref:Uncharacterized protein n=1 Tax=Nelumbo nucifera TaxID=4432 RepID=A0A822YFL7_NELNU|nr:TPA_asm: hypothetical protein HUJ06_029786 [Nelumbo nucifera]
MWMAIWLREESSGNFTIKLAMRRQTSCQNGTWNIDNLALLISSDLLDQISAIHILIEDVDVNLVERKAH